MKTSSKIIIAVLAVVVVAALIVIFIFSSSRTAQVEFDKIETTILEKGDLEQVVFADGQVRSENYTQIYASFTGVVKEINISEGQDVIKDDLLMKIEVAGATREIKATIDGKVTNIWAQLENQVTPGQVPLLEIVDFNTLLVEGLVLESDINKVAVDQKVKLEFPAIDEEDTDFSGTVTFISQSPNTLNTSSPSYRMKVRPDEIPDSVKFGMSTNMEIIVNSVPSVFYVDNVYLTTKDDGQYVVKLIDRASRQVEEIEVEIGFEGENESEILDGVEVGDEVMLPSIDNDNFGIFGSN